MSWYPTDPNITGSSVGTTTPTGAAKKLGPPEVTVSRLAKTLKGCLKESSTTSGPTIGPRVLPTDVAIVASSTIFTMTLSRCCTYAILTFIPTVETSSLNTGGLGMTAGDLLNATTGLVIYSAPNDPVTNIGFTVSSNAVVRTTHSETTHGKESLKIETIVEEPGKTSTLLATMDHLTSKKLAITSVPITPGPTAYNSTGTELVMTVSIGGASVTSVRSADFYETPCDADRDLSPPPTGSPTAAGGSEMMGATNVSV